MLIHSNSSNNNMPHQMRYINVAERAVRPRGRPRPLAAPSQSHADEEDFSHVRVPRATVGRVVHFAGAVVQRSGSAQKQLELLDGRSG